MKTFQVTIIRSQYEYYEVEAETEEEALDKYSDSDPYETDTIDISFSDVREV